MPIYEYVCNACSHEFEEWQKITDAPVQRCPACGKRKVERLVSLSAFHLKGSGWYVTDYAGKKTDSAPGKEQDQKDQKDKDQKDQKDKKQDQKQDQKQKDQKDKKEPKDKPAKTEEKKSASKKAD